jgi:hypothetical protein
MKSIALTFASVVLLTTTISPAAHAGVVSGTANGAVTILGPSGPVAQVNGSYQIDLPPGQYTAFCGNRPATPSSFQSLSTPVTVNFTCPS